MCLCLVMCVFGVFCCVHVVCVCPRVFVLCLHLCVTLLCPVLFSCVQVVCVMVVCVLVRCECPIPGGVAWCICLMCVICVFDVHAFVCVVFLFYSVCIVI